jgi:hypothetical protein
MGTLPKKENLNFFSLVVFHLIPDQEKNGEKNWFFLVLQMRRMTPGNPIISIVGRKTYGNLRGSCWCSDTTYRRTHSMTAVVYFHHIPV